MFGLKEMAARTARQAGLASGGALMICVGVGFLTLAAWIYLEISFGAQISALIIAGFYLGVGFILLGLAGSGSSQPVPESEEKQAPESAEGPPIMQAFLYGLQAGMAADRRRS